MRRPWLPIIVKALDRYLQRARIARALRQLPQRASVIDIGAHQGELFTALGARLERGFGIEPVNTTEIRGHNYVIRPGYFPEVSPDEPGSWDAVTLLAVLEHIPPEGQGRLAAACADFLKPGGRVVITVPSPQVDHILWCLRTLRLISGMSLEEHYGFKPADVPRIFGAPHFRLLRHSRFQFGLNHLFVFERTSAIGTRFQGEAVQGNHDIQTR